LTRCFGFIRKWGATDAAAYESLRLREGLLDKTNTASAVWADTAYRSATNEEFMEKNGFVGVVTLLKIGCDSVGSVATITPRRALRAKSAGPWRPSTGYDWNRRRRDVRDLGLFRSNDRR
jgi:hypothetical protein